MVAVLTRVIVLVRILYPATGVDNQIAPGQELVRHANGLVERATWIVADVEQQLLHSELVQLAQRRSQLARARFREVFQAHVADRVGDHEGALDRRNGDLIPLYFQLDEPVIPPSPDRHNDRTALRSAQLLDRLVAGDADSVLSGDAGDDVAASNARAIRR